MERTSSRNLRVLIVGKKAATVHLLRMTLNLAGIANVVACAETERALDLLKHENFDAVYCDELADKIDRVAFPRAARNTEGVLNAMMPIFLVYSRAGRSQVERARDDGVTSVLTVPISAATIVRKLNTALAHPRPFIVASEFFGPDRRVGSRKGFIAKERRSRVPRKVRINAPDKPSDGSSEEVQI